MRKLWFAHLAKAIVIFPGGFGTMDEMLEILTLAQTQKLDRPLFVLLYGASYWREIIDFNALARHGMIAEEDLHLPHFADTPSDALRLLKQELSPSRDAVSPDFAKSITSCCDPAEETRKTGI